MFNDLCTEKTERQYRIDLEKLRRDIGKKTKEETACIVDQAKAEALDAMGEYRAAREIAAKYLQ